MFIMEKDDIFLGGCVRIKERLKTRMLKTSEKELGVSINLNPSPLAIRETIESDDRTTLYKSIWICIAISFINILMEEKND